MSQRFETTMSQTRKRAWAGVVIWGVAGTVFTVAFLAGGGPTAFAAESVRVAVSAAAMGVAYAAYFGFNWLTRSRGRVEVDERDTQVVGGAAQAALIVTLLSVYLLGIGLWLGYEAAEVVPVGWMWFLAYGTVIVGSAAYSVAALVLDTRLGGRG